jgi:alpha-tubulin suppressor-like RCC1 family protein
MNLIFKLNLGIILVMVGCADDDGIHRSSFSDCVQVTAGSEHSCCLHEDGHVSCWGNSDNGKLNPPQGQRFLTVSAGGQYTCGINTERKIICWGSNDVCIGNTDDCTDIGTLDAPDDTGFVSLDAGSGHACALNETGFIYCWGSNGSEQINSPSTQNFIQVSVGCDHSCGLQSDGKLTCWGDDGYAQVTLPREIENKEYRFSQIGLGCYHTCALFSDQLSYRCWGSNSFGQAPSNTYTDKAPITAIASGAFFNCRIKSVGGIDCWGSDVRSQLEEPQGTAYQSIDAGSVHACAVDFSGRVTCWGDNYFGQASPP